MAAIKKTYLRKNNDTIDLVEKENCDPFDELLSSPLKRDVEFKPLSFWHRKGREKSKHHVRKIPCGLYMTDSDDADSPANKKKRLKYECLERKSRMLRMRDPNSAEISIPTLANSKLSTSELESVQIDDKFQFVTLKRDFSKSEESSRLFSSPSNEKNLELEKYGVVYRGSSFFYSPKNEMGMSKSQNISYEELLSLTNCSFEDSTLELLLNKSEFNLEFEDIFNQFACSEALDGLNDKSTPETTVLNASNNSTFDSDYCEDSTVCHVDDTVLKVSEENKVPFSEKNQQKDVTAITSLLSDMTMLNKTANDHSSSDSTAHKSSCDSNEEEDPKEFPAEAFRFVTTRRRYRENSLQDKPTTSLNNFKRPSVLSQKINKRESGFDKFGRFSSNNESRLSIAWDRFSCMPNPIFESTRVGDPEELENLEGTRGGFEHSIVLKSGKQWTRSMSVLKQIQNGSLVPNNLESTQIKGRRFQSFVQEMMAMQNDGSAFSTMIPETSNYKSLRNEDVEESCLFKSALDFQDAIQKETEISSYNESRRRTILDRTTINHTVKVIQPESSLERPSAFRNALKLDAGETKLEETVLENGVVKEGSSVISPKDFILAQCGQEDVLPFEDYFNEKTLQNCKKIGEGVYGEVFMCNSDTVIKVIPIEGSDKVNGEPQKKFEEILSEVVIAMKLSNLREGEKNRTSGFSELKKCWCVFGKYPKFLLELWDEYDRTGTGSENDSPVMFKSDQIYIVLELANGGKCLESYVFNSSEQSLSVFIQTAFSLAVAEKAFEFEHRDLHWGNVLISKTTDKFTSVILDGMEYKIPTKGVKVSIIDFTLSRVSHEGCCIFNDLSVDPSLFASQGDYQFEIYRMMQEAVRFFQFVRVLSLGCFKERENTQEVQWTNGSDNSNDWSVFEPKTNLFWLHYTLDKMLYKVYYKNKKAQVHKKYLKQLKVLEKNILQYVDSSDFVLNQKLI